MKHAINVTRNASPLELEGTINDGRPFYFRAEGGYWSFSVLPESLDPRSYDGPSSYICAEGSDPLSLMAEGGEEEAWALVSILCDIWSFTGDHALGQL